MRAVGIISYEEGVMVRGWYLGGVTYESGGFYPLHTC